MHKYLVLNSQAILLCLVAWHEVRIIAVDAIILVDKLKIFGMQRASRFAVMQDVLADFVWKEKVECCTKLTLATWRSSLDA
jgi:hypothetical protein